MAAASKKKAASVSNKEEAGALSALSSEDPFVAAICKPLAAPAKGDLEDEPQFDVIDDALMKRGTLSHGSINWSEVQEAALELLSKKSKDLRLVEAVCLALTQNATRDSLVSGYCGLYAFLELPADQRQPKQERAIHTQLSRIVSSLSRKEFPGPQGKLTSELMEVLTRLAGHELIRAAALGKHFSDIKERLSLENGAGAETTSSESGDAQSAGNTAQNAKQASGTSQSRSPEKSQSSETDWRALKRSAGEIADTLYDLDPTAPVSYQLRRAVTWGDITAPPPIKDAPKTIVPPVAVDTIDRYSSALAGGAVDGEQVKRLERTLQSTPFWLDGHKIAADFAARLGREKVQEAILRDLFAFLVRFPEIRELKYADGTPLVSEETVGALTTLETGSDSASADAHSAVAAPNERPGVNVDELAQLVSDGGDAESWNRAFKTARSPRTRALMELSVLEQMSGAGLYCLAAEQAGRLKSWAGAHSIEDWEPDLVARLDHLVSREG